jgi:hypothetical protein
MVPHANMCALLWLFISCAAILIGGVYSSAGFSMTSTEVGLVFFLFFYAYYSAHLVSATQALAWGVGQCVLHILTSLSRSPLLSPML